MKIGIIVYSLSGHTLKVAQVLEEKLTTAGHKTTLVQLEPVGRLKRSAKTVGLRSVPTVDSFDTLILGAGVHGGRMAAPLASFIEKVPTFKGKDVLCLVTQFFPRNWGGKQTLQSMEALCTSKGAKIIGAGGVTWACFQRKHQINELVNEFIELV